MALIPDYFLSFIYFFSYDIDLSYETIVAFPEFSG
jgi:hypothetical protein